MISYADALALIHGLKLAPKVARLPLEECEGLRLAEDLVARVASPPHTNSAMDGFALRHEDITAGAHLEILGTILARAVDPLALPKAKKGGCVRIMTGGYVPDWCDTVVPVEDSVPEGDAHVRFTKLPTKGDSIRREGEDLTAGSLVLKAGVRLDAERLMVAAGLGHARLAVELRPRLALLSTGDELVEPGETLAPGAVYNSSKYFLLASAKALGLQATHRTLADDPTAAAMAIEALAQNDDPTIIISTGAVSAGEADFIPRLAERLGFTALMHRVAIRPGKPVFLAQKGRVLWLGLPGNAISTSVGWHFFARPLLATVAGTPPARMKKVRLANDVGKPPHLRCLFRAELSEQPAGTKAWVTKRQGSAHLGASITANAYVVLPEGQARLPADTEVEALLI